MSDDILREEENNDVVETENETTIVVTIGGNDREFNAEELGINFDSPESEILNAMEGILSEAGDSLREEGEDGDFSYTVRKATNSRKIYVFPKPTAG